MSDITLSRYKNAYKQVTGREPLDIPDSLRNGLVNSKPLSAREFAHLSHEEATAYLIAHKIPVDIGLKQVERNLRRFEKIYGMPSHVFMDKWQNGELKDEFNFFLWESDYKVYLKHKGITYAD